MERSAKMGYYYMLAMRKKLSFPLKISPVNLTTAAVSCGFGLIHCRNL